MAKNQTFQEDEGNTAALTIGLELKDLHELVEGALQQWTSARSQSRQKKGKSKKSPIDEERKAYIPAMQDLQFKMVPIDHKLHYFAKYIGQKADCKFSFFHSCLYPQGG